MRTALILSLIAILSLACGSGDSAEPDTESKMACANITNENWRTSVMVRPSYDHCVEVVAHRRNLGGGNPRPCIFGEYPMVCSDTPEGLTLYKANFSTMGGIIFIDGPDAEKVRPHILYL